MPPKVNIEDKLRQMNSYVLTNVHQLAARNKSSLKEVFACGQNHSLEEKGYYMYLHRHEQFFTQAQLHVVASTFSLVQHCSSSSSQLQPLCELSPPVKKARVHATSLCDFQGYGKSCNSIVPFSLRECFLSEGSLQVVSAACDSIVQMHDSHWSLRDGGHGRQLDFRLCKDAPAISCNGSKFHLDGGFKMHRLHAQLIHALKDLLFDIESHASAIWYQHGMNRVPAFPPPHVHSDGSSSAFVFGSIKDYPLGTAASSIHCDGGPSMIFLAITLSGERWLEIESVHPETGDIEEIKRVHCTPGHVYLSSPACFWHRVCPDLSPGDKGLQRTLILRSNCLKWRLSGGSVRLDGSRTAGMQYGTADAFERMSEVVDRAIAAMDSFSLDFDES